MTQAEKYAAIAANNEAIAANVPKVYEAGKQAEYNAFWDSYQISPTGAIGIRGASRYRNWSAQCFKPKYDMKPIEEATYMFATLFGSSALDVPRYDLAQWLEDLGVTLDLSNTPNAAYLFYFASVTRVPVLDLRGIGNTKLYDILSHCYYLETIDKLIIPSTGANEFPNSFYRCDSLKNIIIEGVVGKSVDFRHSPLTKASITNIFEHLSDTSIGQTLTLNLTAVNTAFETSSGANDGSTSAEFAALVATKTNWTITMI